MTFRLTTAGCFYSAEQAEKLSRLGFKLQQTCEPTAYRFGDWYMPNGQATIEINTLDELMEFVKEWGDIVLSEGNIQIYDDYRE
jgi:pectin methylesterase-like acyl-CoA thioesterase